MRKAETAKAKAPTVSGYDIYMGYPDPELLGCGLPKPKETDEDYAARVAGQLIMRLVTHQEGSTPGTFSLDQSG